MNSKVRKAKFDDIKQINEMYDQAQFSHSNFEMNLLQQQKQTNKEQVYRSGRMIDTNDKSAKMNEIYVLQCFRDFCTATKIIEFFQKITITLKIFFVYHLGN